MASKHCFLSNFLSALPPSLDSSGGRSEGRRTNRRSTVKWQKNDNAGWGPPADRHPFHRGPDTQGPVHPPPPAPYHHSGTAYAASPYHMLKKGFFSALDLSCAATPWPQESALSHSLSIPALLWLLFRAFVVYVLLWISSPRRSWSSNCVGFRLELWCCFPQKKKSHSRLNCFKIFSPLFAFEANVSQSFFLSSPDV